MFALFWISCGILIVGLWYKFVEPKHTLFNLKDIIGSSLAILLGPVALILFSVITLAIWITDYIDDSGWRTRTLFSIRPRK
jgi:hypothetical protein